MDEFSPANVPSSDSLPPAQPAPVEVPPPRSESRAASADLESSETFRIKLAWAKLLWLLVFLAVLSAVAVAAIPGGSLPLIAGLLVAFGIPPEGIGIILGVDRILDMTRTMTNVGSDLVTTAVVDAGQRRQYGS